MEAQNLIANKSFGIEKEFAGKNALARAFKASKIGTEGYERSIADKLRIQGKNVTRAFVVTVYPKKVAVMYVFQCDITLLNTFEPYCSCVSDGKFSAVCIQKKTILVTPPMFTREEMRKQQRSGNIECAYKE